MASATPAGTHDFSGDHTREVIGAYYDVYNALPRGLLESAYAGALHAELRAIGMPVEREAPLVVHHRGQAVGRYRADFIVDRQLILELKCVPRLRDPDRRQLFHYLRITNMPLGLLLNFGVRAEVARVMNFAERRA